jgi:hypothetical protein
MIASSASSALSGASLPSVGELLSVDREYRRRARRGELPLIAPRCGDPLGARWLPVLHTTRDGHRYTALFSNTEQAHRFRRTRDWVVLYDDGAGADHRHTVVTARLGPLKGRRVVRGREQECWDHFGLPRGGITRKAS